MRTWALRERVLIAGWEGPSSALKATGGGGGSSCQGGEGATSTSGTDCTEGRDESPGTSLDSYLGVCDATAILISRTFLEISLFRLRLSLEASPPAIPA